jgi:hypothetical protein
MHLRYTVWRVAGKVARQVAFSSLLALCLPAFLIAQPPAKPAACRRALIDGDLNAGKPFSQEIGEGLKVFFQPIHSGWILRVLPASGSPGEHDYAELATPPYQSVNPLSISTDFAFRAQDAVGWNPRRFRFATSAASFRELQQAYLRFEGAGIAPPEEVQADLSRQIAKTAEGKLTILDSRLVPGNADQWRMAAAVASHFETTAHTLVQEPDGSTSPLGRLVWLRFQLELDLPQGFAANAGMRLAPGICGAR